jgi:hypothetical protein
MSRIGFQLISQAVHVHLEQVSFTVMIFSPGVFKQLILWHNVTSMLCQLEEEAVLGWGKSDLSACQRHQVLGIVNRQLADDYGCL